MTVLADHQRRTFALISHPDAGKTTLTEKLLLGGGAIHIAGEVKARGARRHAHSDWMEMERKRGISITSSVMTFEYRGITFNLLDTPGHQDFSEDTYRTLSAVDSAIMVLDAAKGIEAQTRKLFEVCRMRDIPIMTFINKMDRETQDPFDLLNEIEKSLALDACPMTWPVGNSHDFRGCYHLRHNSFMPFRSDKDHQLSQIVTVTGPADPALRAFMSEQQQRQLCDDIELLKEVGKPFDFNSYREGHLTPVYFGSALSNYGVNSVLEGLYDIAPPPGEQESSLRTIAPADDHVTGFVFKIQANMDPQHRDRVAFVRLCSGVFRRGMKLKQVRTDKMFAVQNPVFFLARERSLTETAYPGDIIGIPNHGTLRIGDTLTEGENLHFKGIPSFAPEILRRVYLTDPMKAKNLRKGLEDLAEEGISQLFKPLMGSDWIVGVVGQLQLDVLMARIETEYKVPVRFEPVGYDMARWIYSEDKAALNDFIDRNKSKIAEDIDGRPVCLVASSWELKYTEEKFPDIRFSMTREQFG